LQGFSLLNNQRDKAHTRDGQTGSPSRNYCQADLGRDEIDDRLLFLGNLRNGGAQTRLQGHSGRAPNIVEMSPEALILLGGRPERVGSDLNGIIHSIKGSEQA
jgi:hypothetical protein